MWATRDRMGTVEDRMWDKRDRMQARGCFLLL